MINFNYSFQSCDTQSNQNEKRYCGDDRTLLSKKSLTSFLNSIKYSLSTDQGRDCFHDINIITDKCSEDYINYIKKCVEHYENDNIKIKMTRVHESGIMNSIKQCYEWLEENGKEVVYQVQDDYLFYETAIYEMAAVLFQAISDLKTHPIIVSYNVPYFWLTNYRYKVIPTMFFPSAKRYWMQCYDIPCTFMTTKVQFSQHWDCYDKFLNSSSLNPRLEADTINKILVDKGVLGLQPTTSIALHMQSEHEKDPFIDWKNLWDSVKLI